MNTLELTRNIGISAHIDSGKTTLTERMLFYAGRIHKMEEVRGDGDGATMDHMELEREKGITITSASTTVDWGKNKINIIDTPGHVDFTVEVERSLRVLDGAVLVLCGVAGVQSQSITVDRQMKRYKVPRLAFINKLDRTGADPYKVTDEICNKLGHHAVMIQIPIGLEDKLEGIIDLVKMKAIYNKGEFGERREFADIPESMQSLAERKRAEMLEEICMYDEQLMEEILEDKEIHEERIHAAIKKGVQTLELTPVLVGSAFKNRGVQALLDALCRYLPNPIEATHPLAFCLDSEDKTLELEPDANKALVAMAFKITDDQYGQLTYTRIYQGTMKKGMNIRNTRTGKRSRLGRLIRMHADERENMESASGGDIVAMVGVDCASGDTFCDENINVSLESIYVPTPVISYSITCAETADYDKLGKALTRFIKEDPTFHVHTDEESGETIISGMGELHLEIYLERIRREYKAEVEVGPPQVNYREAISKNVKIEYTHKKQTGGAGQFAMVVGDISPHEFHDTDADELDFNNLIKGGNIPSEYIPSVEKGFHDAMASGPLAAFPVVAIYANIRDGKHHEVDSSDLAFRTCARIAMQKGILKANPTLLEPIMKVEIEAPIDSQGPVVGDISSRRGIIASIEAREKLCIIYASVPLAEMFGYATALRSLTAGKATYTMEFEKYGQTPRSIQERVIESRKDKLRISTD